MKIIFLFPGYGSQFVGMGKGLYDDFRIVQEYFEEASQCVGQNFVKLCFAASDVELGRMEHAYPSLFLVSCAIAQLLKQQGIHPDAVAGYNIGECAAIHTAHGLTFPDGLYLLSKYVTFYQEAFAHGDISGIRISGLSYDQVSALCAQESGEGFSVYVAACEQEDVFVVMGYKQAVGSLRVILKDNEGVVTQEVPMEFGLYSSLMNHVAAQCKMYMEKVDFKDLEVPLYANVDAQPVTLGWQVKERSIDQITHEIRWNDILKNLDEFDCVVQVGPGTEIQKMVHAIYPEKICVVINTKADIKALKKIINPVLEEQEEHKDANI